MIFSHHVWCMNHGNRQENLSGQGENGHLMLYGIGGEGEDSIPRSGVWDVVRIM